MRGDVSFVGSDVGPDVAPEARERCGFGGAEAVEFDEDGAAGGGRATVLFWAMGVSRRGGIAREVLASSWRLVERGPVNVAKTAASVSAASP